MLNSFLSTTPLTTLSGVGAVLGNRLAKLGLSTLHDLLFHFPLRYEDRTRIYPINTLTLGLHATVEGEVLSCEVLQGKRRMLLCRISDPTGIISLRFLYFNAGIKNAFQIGKKVRAFGEIKRGKHHYEIIHPQYTFNLTPNAPNSNATLTPVYPTTEGLTQTVLRQLTDQALALLTHNPPPELLPAHPLLESMPLVDAIKLIHRPPPGTDLVALEQGKHPAQLRLIKEELLAHHLSLLLLRQQTQQHPALPLPQRQLADQLLNALPFTLTGAQQRVFEEIYHDVCQPKPMMRLVQGDVGSGKTIIAALSALLAIAEGKQAALLAPTELLAEQHLANFTRWLTPFGINIGWLLGKQKGKKRQQQMQDIATGQVQMVIGTHALFQDPVEFHDLALVIIDEQHRFGVNQRLNFWEKGQQKTAYPHQLVMTATPIPRTLSMTAYADLDVSIIDELPPNRTPITTVAIPDSRRLEIIERVKRACEERKQVYWVCTLIKESEVLEAQAAEETFEDLKLHLPDCRIGLVHGKMKADEKQAIMQQFKAGDCDLLVATTVIEVGVDVPNASLMIIENPERLGLAQLHQLRGRVGRGDIASHCVLLYKTPLSQTAKKRLQVMRESHDGFYIAEQDLEIRGPGEILGTRQTGSIAFKIADLARDKALIPQIHRLAHDILRQSPKTSTALIARWLPQKEKYLHA